MTISQRADKNGSNDHVLSPKEVAKCLECEP